MGAMSCGEETQFLGTPFEKECDETAYWLELLHATDFLNEKEFESMHDEANQILRMLKSAIITSKDKLNRKL